ncbi:DUF2163 domain-containing protein [Falsirhodobacter halotolerans]|uniref:DUF2163 domain-containing protein n=1 Tax=Falsirhodobacter halotolerans TaxID=1146892 RepID=UPI001FD1D286|nr:DUF2163 domain-containing protein [Falsirhodobacter halotolerans]MCJ8139306.1 DUF2163 domain-containing protein [Falsirhodobacter halotolerans]
MSLGDHLASGLTTVCRAWAITRSDGQVLGFTDHDRDLRFGGIAFRANSGLNARALQQATGLSVDNTEALGALSDAGISETDIRIGKFDGAGVRCWLVNWADVVERELEFSGSIGDISFSDGVFRVELRGPAEALNRPQGRVFQRGCSAVLGDMDCGFDLSRAGFAAELPVEVIEDRRVFRFGGLVAFDDRWFERGRLRVLSGVGTGAVGLIKNDRLTREGRLIELWEALGPAVGEGDAVRLEAGCDRRADTCRLKFNNLVNFRGFPHIPGEDWLAAYPTSAGKNDGGSLFR